MYKFSPGVCFNVDSCRLLISKQQQQQQCRLTGEGNTFLKSLLNTSSSSLPFNLQLVTITTMLSTHNKKKGLPFCKQTQSPSLVPAVN